MRIRTILAVTAAPAALAAALLGTAGQASAATVPDPGHGAVVITSQAQADALGGTINKNVDVPAGATIQLRWVHVTGNVSVEGQLSVQAVTFDRNVDVSGPGSMLWLFNDGSHIGGNLSVTGSSGAWMGNSDGTSLGDNTSSPSQVDGNFSFTGNTGRLYVGSPLTVARNFTLSGNGPYNNPAAAIDTTGLNVAGHTSTS